MQVQLRFGQPSYESLQAPLLRGSLIEGLLVGCSSGCEQAFGRVGRRQAVGGERPATVAVQGEDG